MARYREFKIPPLSEIFDVLAIEPRVVDDDGIIALDVVVGEESMVIVMDTPGQSVHCRWTRGEQLLLELFREAATSVGVRQERGVGSFVDAKFSTDDVMGAITFQVAPILSVRDTLLFGSLPIE